jgi:hypothetical protein
MEDFEIALEVGMLWYFLLWPTGGVGETLFSRWDLRRFEGDRSDTDIDEF